METKPGFHSMHSIPLKLIFETLLCPKFHLEERACIRVCMSFLLRVLDSEPNHLLMKLSSATLCQVTSRKLFSPSASRL